LHFDFDVIDLPRMKAGAFVKMKNPAALALAARMKADPRDRVSLTRDLFISLARTKIRREEKDLVAGFFSNYQPLSRDLSGKSLFRNFASYKSFVFCADISEKGSFRMGL
jgi:hypothetical protein